VRWASITSSLQKMTQSRFHPRKEIESYLKYYPSKLHDIVFGIRSLVVSIEPNAKEMIQRKGFTYYDEERGGPVSAGICQIILQSDHIRLAFIHGAFLPDPHHLLAGNGKAKRFVSLYTYEKVPWKEIKSLIIASSKFDPRILM
jgi:hypothetical protein